MNEQLDPNCIFCRIIAGELPSDTVAESDQALAFRDLNPQAPTHVLVVPKQHLPAFRYLGPENAELLIAMASLANEVARNEGLLEDGFRIIINDGPAAGQTVFHLHVHVLGGKTLTPALG
jgi:histidine triad (HIT) family protein